MVRTASGTRLTNLAKLHHCTATSRHYQDIVQTRSRTPPKHINAHQRTSPRGAQALLISKHVMMCRNVVYTPLTICATRSRHIEQTKPGELNNISTVPNGILRMPAPLPYIISRLIDPMGKRLVRPITCASSCDCTHPPRPQYRERTIASTIWTALDTERAQRTMLSLRYELH